MSTFLKTRLGFNDCLQDAYSMWNTAAFPCISSRLKLLSSSRRFNFIGGLAVFSINWRSLWLGSSYSSGPWVQSQSRCEVNMTEKDCCCRILLGAHKSRTWYKTSGKRPGTWQLNFYSETKSVVTMRATFQKHLWSHMEVSVMLPV